jgi:class 3 adenylate cyclase
MALTTGTVTLLFTDIEGSASLWESAPKAMQVPLQRHDGLLRSVNSAAPRLRWSTKPRREDSDPCGSRVVMALLLAES